MSNELRSTGEQPTEPANENKTIRDLLPAFALGATDPEEELAVKQALASDASLACELGQYMELTNALLASTPPVPPPPALAGKLQAALNVATPAGEPQATPNPAALAGDPQVGPNPGARQAAPNAAPNAAPAPSANPGRRWHWPQWLAAAAIIILLLLNLYWVSEVFALRTQQAALQQQLADQHAQQAMLQQQVASQDRLLGGIMANHVERYVMAAAQPNSPAEAQVAWLPGTDLAVLTASRFPTLKPGQVYQLWLLRDGQRTSGGLFTVTESGDGTYVFTPPEPLESFEGMGITPEPAGGSPGPTAPPIVTAQL